MLYTYRFQINYTDHHSGGITRGIKFIGTAYIKAPTLEEAIYIFKQHRYQLQEEPQNLTISPTGQECGFDVEVVETNNGSGNRV